MLARRLIAGILSTLVPVLVSAAMAPDAVPSVLDANVIAVRVLLGVGDASPQDWGGSASVDRGEIVALDGYRFRKGDHLSGPTSWDAKTRLIRKAAVAKKKAAAIAKQEVGGPSTYGATVTPNGVIVTLKSPEDATLSIQTKAGVIPVKLADLATGGPRTYLDGKVIAQRVPPTIPLTNQGAQEDFPAAVSDGHGGAWVVFVSHEPRGEETSTAYTSRPRDFANLKPSGGGDQIKLLHYENGKAGEPIDVTDPGLDIWRPAIAEKGNGDLVIVWSENRDGNFDLYRRAYRRGAKLWDGPPVRLTDNPGADTDPALATRSDGRVWMAWQAWRDGRASIIVDDVENPRDKEEPRVISPGAGNAWSPAVAADKKGNLFVVYDTYETGNYDVHLRRLSEDGTAGKTIAVASSPRYEARPSLAVDPRGRVWISYEERTENWGKDAENLVKGKGSSLYRKSAVRVKCVDSGRVLDAPDPLDEVSVPLREMNGFPRLATDSRGRVWLAFRHRQEAIWGNNAVMVAGGVWVEYVTSLAGKTWEPPQPLSASDGLLDNRPALVASSGDDPLLIVHNSDGRLRREVEFLPELAQKYYSHSGTPPGVINNDIFLSSVNSPRGGAVDPVANAPADEAPALVETPHPREAVDVARMRDYRVNAGGKNLRLVRGDFHRHTEISQDGGSDGALEDMWRYAIDAAAFDWMGNADHDNGGGKEYTWWLVQKTTDLYNSPKLVTMFTYERSVAYPHGHRNVMFDTRGVRTLPRLLESGVVADSDTLMLYDYLKEHQGICASHTSGTGMGTDWRDLNPTYEPLVEIFQGHRNSYEHLGAPRVARRPGEAIGGWRPLGMVWNALAMQYRLGFQASSDHISTHISYAIALAEDNTRACVLDAFRRRHCYGATDNIVLDVRCGDAIMGDELQAPADGPVKLKVFVQGTRPIARVDVIKDFMYVYSTEPNAEKVSFEWTDNETRGPGLSWYYVRAIQDNGELAWGSPIWVRFPTATTGK